MVSVKSDDIPSLTIFQHNNPEHTSAVLSDHGLVVADTNGRAALLGLVEKDGTPALGLLDKNGKVIWKAP